ncbi:MAG: hypothetical protein ACTHNA_14375 [Sphingopyxis terrae]|uniref:hypothetical protein n=1 Tax=Sphingopyxis terrae TaxID=33052 RepID=UPI003F7FA12D
MAVYGVRHKASGKIRLVDAKLRVQALNHVAGDEYAVTIPAAREIAELARQGVIIEDYGAEPEAPVAEEGEG